MKEVEIYIEKKNQWKPELNLLRKTLLSTNLEETIKWGAPVYVNKGKNIVGLSAFKNYVGLWFFQGGTLQDKEKVLMNAQEGKTNAMRQWRFSSIDEIDVELVKTYILEAIENQLKGTILKPKKNTSPLVIHKLLKKALRANKNLETQFEAFSLSKKREFTNYIIEAKRESTKITRLEKIIPLILNGAGLYDKYKNC